jgi:hypothetical protein
MSDAEDDNQNFNLVDGKPKSRKSSLTNAIRKLSGIIISPPNHHHELEDDNSPAAAAGDSSSLGVPPTNRSRRGSTKSNRGSISLNVPLPQAMEATGYQELVELSKELEQRVLKLLDSPEEKAKLKLDSPEIPSFITQLIQDAQRGDAKAQFSLGAYYHLGEVKGIAVNPLQAIKWYCRAATSGSVPAINNLGVMLMKGVGLDPNEKAAAKWLEYAAITSENTFAMVNLGILLTKPAFESSLQNYDRAFQLYYRAAKYGSTIAQNNLGCMLARGYGCDKDEKKAMKYFKRSSDGGSAAAKYNVGVLYQNGWGIKADFAKAKEWFDAASADPNHDEYPYVIADNDPSRFLLLTSIVTYRG